MGTVQCDVEPEETWGAKRVKAGHKPGSVLLPLEGGGHLSGIAVADDLERRTKAERGRWPTVVPRPCSQPGFTEPAPLDAAGALLPHLCTLACAGEPAIGGVFLWHSPHGHPHWALPSKPGHWGARTFLSHHCKQRQLRSPRLLSNSKPRSLAILSFQGAVAQPDRATVS